MPPALTEPIRGAFRKVRDAVNGKTIKARLDSAVAEVRRLEDERQRIISECSDQTDVSRFDVAVEEAKAHFEEEQNVEAEINWILAQMVAERARASVAGMVFAKSSGYLIGMEWSEFVRQFPMWRDALRGACQFKLEVAQQEFQKTEMEITRQLREQGFDDEQIADDLRIRRARREMERWAGAPQRCIEEKDGERLWNGLINRFSTEGNE